jgi:fructokinase
MVEYKGIPDVRCPLINLRLLLTEKVQMKTKPAKIVCIGEILADFVPEGKCHVLRPGGALSNVAVNLARIGADSAVIAKVGDDFLGKFLKEFVKSNGVDVFSVTLIKGFKTGLVFVFPGRNGINDFSFYGHPSADTMLSPDDVKESVIRDCGMLHFGSIGAMEKNNKAATLRALELADKFEKIISYDPNVRLNLWEGKYAACKKHVKKYFGYADIIKISDTELKFISGAKPLLKVLKKTFRPDQLVFVSVGENGCYVKYGDFFTHVPGKKVRVIDATGAGDAFMAGVLYMVSKKGKGLNLTQRELVETAEFANKKGAEAVTRKGAV